MRYECATIRKIIVKLSLFGMISFFCVCLGVNFPAYAETTLASTPSGGDIYNVGGVSQSVWSQDLVTSKAAALNNARRLAFHTLCERMLLQEDAASLSSVSDDDIQGLVRDVAIDSEKLGAQSYSARFTVRFDPVLVRQYFAQHGLSFIETQSQPLLIIPAMGAGSSMSLWPMQWSNAWKSKVLGDNVNNVVPFIIASGNGDDRKNITASNVASSSADALSYISNRYGTGSYALVRVNRSGNNYVFSVDLYGSSFASIKAPKLIYIPQSDSNALNEGVTQTINAINETWKQLNVHGKDVSIYKSSISADSLETWLAYKKKLQSILSIQSIAVDDFSVGRIVVDIAFRGGEEQFKVALLQKNIVATYDSDNNIWVLNFK